VTKDYLNQLNGYINDDISTFSGGLNTYSDKAFVETNQLPYAMNICSYKPPMICPRPSRKYIFEAPSEDYRIVSLYAVDSETIYYIARTKIGASQLLCCAEKQNDGRWDTYEYNTLQLPDAETLYFCQCKTATNNYLYICGANYKAKADITSGEHASYFTPIVDNHYGIPCWHKGRLFLADQSSRVITFSALYDYDNFTPVPEGEDPLDIDYSSYAGDFFVTNSKGRIQNIVSFDDKLVIFCKHSIHLLYGDTPLLTSSSQFQLVDLNNNLGCSAPQTVSVGGGNLYWLGDDREVYAFSGAYFDLISKPAVNKRVQRYSAISNLNIAEPGWTIAGGDNDIEAFGVATSTKYYISLPIEQVNGAEKRILFVFDATSNVWWAEDGEPLALSNFSSGIDGIVFSNKDGDVFEVTKEHTGYDSVLVNGYRENIPIKYEFHTKVYGADGLDSRKSLSKVWLQASADADVFLTDSWTSSDQWHGRLKDASLKKIGTLTQKGQKEMTSEYLDTYSEYDYEQQVCYVQKMYGQRLNTFQIVIRGSGPAKFYLMKRDWDAR